MTTWILYIMYIQFMHDHTGGRRKWEKWQLYNHIFFNVLHSSAGQTYKMEDIWLIDSKNRKFKFMSHDDGKYFLLFEAYN